MQSTPMVEEIARGYAVANLWTAGVDEMSGEYVPDEAKVEELMPYALEAAAAFVHLARPVWIDNSGIDLERIGNCLHYEREGHGIGFADEQGWAANSYAISRLEKVARMMGEDSGMQAQLLNRFPSEAFAA